MVASCTRLLVQWLALALLLLGAAVLAPRAHAQAGGGIDLWDRVTVLSDPTHELDFAGAYARRGEFAKPQAPYANLGPRLETVWVRVALDPQMARGPWWFSIDYPSLDEAVLRVVVDGRVLRTVSLGDHLTVNQRPARTRSHAVELDLPAGGAPELWLSVRTTGPMLLPMQMQRTTEFMLSEIKVGVVQGMGFGFGLCLLMYTVGAFLFTREPLYIWYTLAVGASVLFFFGYCGLGPLLLWPDSAWLTQNLLLLLTLTTLGTGSFFVERSLDFRSMSPRLGRAMITVGAVALLIGAAFALDVLDYRTTMAATAVIGPLPMLLTIPVAFRRARMGDQAAHWTFAGFVMYLFGIVVGTGLMRGTLPVATWSTSAYQLMSTLQAVAWLMVLNVRAAELKRLAAQAQREHDRVLLLSQTDALTGLLNRRGLQMALQPLIDNASAGKLVGVYLMDMDGFKPVNDTHGHEAGDELLKQVGQRLKEAVRNGDLVARMGGDEFVVVASQLRGEAEAEQVGQKLLACCDAPFVLSHAQVRVGLTVGYAVAPQDGRDGDALLRRADAAMYGGKHAGKGRVRRATDSLMPA
jgi:diguanylate cyclase (GGDEF)-like protein